jgi:hypothetical protein
MPILSILIDLGAPDITKITTGGPFSSDLVGRVEKFSEELRV